MSDKLLVLNNYQGSDLYPIGMNPIPPEDREYHASRTEEFYYVFTKDNMPTYHQQVDYFLHWKWNEYHNDPLKYESLEYKTSVLDKVFTFVNARVFGIVNPILNHAEIISTLDKFLDKPILPLIQGKVDHLRGRHSLFTQSDALIWYYIAEFPYSVYGYSPKPLVIPYLADGDRKVSLLPILHQFYSQIFEYAIRYYDYMYEVKWTSTWESVDEDQYIFISEEEPDQIVNYNTLRKISSIPQDEYLTCFIYSEDGNRYDRDMVPYTQCMIAYHEGKYYISSQRGFNLFQYENDILHPVGYVDTLMPKSRNDEAIRTEMWLDIMQSNAVLFPINTEVIFDIRILHYSKYSNTICMMFSSKDRIVTVDEDTDIAIMAVHIDTLWKIFQYMEHTLDLWIRWGRDLEWSLISNMYCNKTSFYRDKPYIPHVDAEDIDLTADEAVFAIIPRDGMCWRMGKEIFYHTTSTLNGYQIRKTYL